MANASSYFDLAGEIYWSAHYGNDVGDLEDLDAKLAEELQFQEAILLSVEENVLSPSSAPPSSSMPKKKSRKSAKKAGESSKGYCEICVDGKQRHQMFTISGCSHSFCVVCISTYVKTRLEQHVTIIKCPGQGCGVMLEIEACRPRLPKEVPWHPGISCEEYQTLGEGERGRDDLMVRNLAKEKKWRNCPSCRFLVERTEGASTNFVMHVELNGLLIMAAARATKKPCIERQG
ncbi:hypothetical protein V6N13_011307 [Hibiscus sabdariffa]|uniref:RING-type domain-containing protein n=1 Tax=Hibiscus sabdariffa TaxID=183260 RepID=A0ABR2SBZ2_9ROSI